MAISYSTTSSSTSPGWWLGVAIALPCFTLFVLLIGIILRRNRARQRNFSPYHIGTPGQVESNYQYSGSPIVHPHTYGHAYKPYSAHKAAHTNATETAMQQDTTSATAANNTTTATTGASSGM